LKAVRGNAVVRRQIQHALAEAGGGLMAERVRTLTGIPVPAEPAEIRFTIYGQPVAQGRARAVIVAGHARYLDPAKSRDYKQYGRPRFRSSRPNPCRGRSTWPSGHTWRFRSPGRKKSRPQRSPARSGPRPSPT
jgi:hypothetical protein